MEINDQLRKQVKEFVESPAGEFYIQKLETFISYNYIKAEENPELSRDFVQNARGVRQALTELKALGIERVKKEAKRR